MVREGLCIRYACSACPVSPCELSGSVDEEIWGNVYAYVAAEVHARLPRCLLSLLLFLFFVSGSRLAITPEQQSSCRFVYQQEQCVKQSPDSQVYHEWLPEHHDGRVATQSLQTRIEQPS